MSLLPTPRVGRITARPDGHYVQQCLCGSVAMGAREEQTLKAFLEAEAFDGPSLIIAYSHCLAPASRSEPRCNIRGRS